MKLTWDLFVIQSNLTTGFRIVSCLLLFEKKRLNIFYNSQFIYDTKCYLVFFNHPDDFPAQLFKDHDNMLAL